MHDCACYLCQLLCLQILILVQKFIARLVLDLRAIRSKRQKLYINVVHASRHGSAKKITIIVTDRMHP